MLDLEDLELKEVETQTAPQPDMSEAQKGGKEKYLPMLALPIGLLWLEFVVKIWDFGWLLNRGTIYTALFTISIGLILSVICTVGSQKTNRLLSLVIFGGLTVYYIVQAVYYTVMRTVLAVYSASVATDASEFWRVGLFGFWRSIPAVMFLIIPFVLLCVFGKTRTPEKLLKRKSVIVSLLLSVAFYGAAVGGVYSANSGILSPWSLYSGQSNPELSLSNFGVLTSLRLDIQRAIVPPTQQTKPEVTPAAPQQLLIPEKDEQGYPANLLDINFEALQQEESDEILAAMHSYFAGQAPTYQNAYTGYFEGKNLIMITAEAFNTWAIDPQRTPTLYRLTQEGFSFENFYTPLWWVSTSDGEYVSCNSLLPKSGVQSFGLAAENSLHFAMGNQLKAKDYSTWAYHNHTYTYYQRDKTHSNMGYTFKGVGNGLKMSGLWPQSDLEMMEITTKDYIGSAPFHVYYMTVSGHLQYFFEENDMAQKHRGAVENLELSEESQAYLACQMELDLALENLLQQLEQAGQLENTVICLYGDHYPYGLSSPALEELGGAGIEQSLELYRSSLILWSGDMKEKVVVEKPCSNLDILPTLLNLFGLEYDSRLLMGSDIFSTAPGLVIFSDSSYITELGAYRAQEDAFTPYDEEMSEEEAKQYAQSTLQKVQDKFTQSANILTTDYYRILGLE